MCDVTRRGLLLSAAGLAGVSASATQETSVAGINKVDPLATGVYFHQGDIEHQGHCNNGWIIFKDYVLVIDANFPSGAQNILPKIRAITPKPIRFAFDTHHHGDHVYGNQVWVDNGATPVAHTGVIDEMKGLEPGAWERTAKSRPDVAASRLNPPSVLFPRELFFDDGEHRVELLHLGVAHTHGARADEALLGDQQLYFKELRERVGAMVQSKKSPHEMVQAVEQIRAELTAKPQIARYVSKEGLPAQVEKVYREMTGESFPKDVKAAHAARAKHALAHALALA